MKKKLCFLQAHLKETTVHSSNWHKFSSEFFRFRWKRPQFKRGCVTPEEIICWQLVTATTRSVGKYSFKKMLIRRYGGCIEMRDNRFCYDNYTNNPIGIETCLHLFFLSQILQLIRSI